MDNILFKTDEPMTIKQILTYYVNVFNDKLIANVIDLNHYVNLKNENPGYKTVNARNERVTVDELIISSRNGVRYARRNSAYMAELLKKEADGNLSEAWSDEAVGLIKSPLFDGQAEKQGDSE